MLAGEPLIMDVWGNESEDGEYGELIEHVNEVVRAICERPILYQVNDHNQAH